MRSPLDFALTARCFAAVFATLIVLAACDRPPVDSAEPPEPVATPEPTPEVDSAAEPEMDEGEGRVASPLDGTEWQLVEIQSMDDTTLTPDVRSNYTVSFGGDGNLKVRSDCNRGMGNFVYTEPSGLEFGPIAMTRAMCPPGSLDGPFNSNLSYVRSFIQKDGNLYLATMADGSILEFEPFTP